MAQLEVMLVARAAARSILARAAEATGLARVERMAPNSTIAMEKLQYGAVDVVLLEIIAAGATWAEPLAGLKQAFPGVFIVAFVRGAADPATVQAAQASGAMDVVFAIPGDAGKSFDGIKNQLQGLFTQIITRRYTATGGGGETLPPTPVAPQLAAPAKPTPPRWLPAGADVVVVASSTGGTTALETICRHLPADLGAPILVVQHLPATLTKKLAQSLARKCKLPVAEAGEGDLVKAGQVLIAPGGVHMAVEAENFSRVTVRLEATPPVNGVRPAADVLFRSVARAYQNKPVLAVILTGMGTDGTAGVEAMKKACQCYCLAQSERTCTIYGMPRSVVDAGLADAVEDLDRIPSRIVSIASGRSF